MDAATLKLAKNYANTQLVSKMDAINANHFFADDTTRDAYFAANPTELATGVLVSSGDVYQMYNGLAWVAKTPISGVTKDIIKKITDVYYVPRVIDAADGTITGGLNAETIKSSDVYALYDALLAEHPAQITKTDLGLDASDTLHVYKYVFDPGTPQYTVVLSANTHGPGVAGDPKDVAITLFNFMHEIYGHWQNDGVLTFMRQQVKFIVIPVVNPWGFDNDSRYNYNNVDINRNFDYRWSAFPSENKGVSAFSEVESQYIRDVLLSVPEAVVYYDFHAYIDIIDFGYIHGAPLYSITTEIAKNLSDHLGPANRSISEYDKGPRGCQYATYILGIPSSNPEFVVYANGESYHSSKQMTKILEWYGNLVWLFLRDYAKPQTCAYSYAYKYASGDSNTITKTDSAGSGVMEELPIVAVELPVLFDGQVIVQMAINSKNATEGAQNFIAPVLYQYGSPLYNENTSMGTMQRLWESYWDGVGRTTTSLSAIIPIFKRCGKLHVGLGGYVSTGSLAINRYKVFITMIPANPQLKVQHYFYNSNTGTYRQDYAYD